MPRPVNFKPRPSTLPALAQCPRFVPRPEDPAAKASAISEAADEGTLIHAFMESLADVPVERWDETIGESPALGPALIPVVQSAAGGVRDLFSVGLPVITKKSLGMGPGDHYRLGSVCLRESDDPAPYDHNYPVCFPARRDLPVRDGVYCEVSLEPGVALPGTADVVAIFGNRAEIVDYKSVRVERDHMPQLKAYALGLFTVATEVETVGIRIVAPRLGDVHERVTFSRADVPVLEEELVAIVERAADDFVPGRAGDACVFCAGNGRCLYQASSLRDAPQAPQALFAPGTWSLVVNPATPELRGERRRLKKIVDTWSEAVAEDDKAWAAENPGTELHGFRRVTSPGRLSLDQSRLRDANQALMTRFGLGMEDYLGCCAPVTGRVAETASFLQALTKADAEKEAQKSLLPYMKRGADIVSFRAIKPVKGELAGTAGAVAGVIE